MLKNKLLVIGGGPFQLPLIKKGIKRGFWVYCTSSIKDDPGLSVADEALNISILDVDSLKEFCSSEKINCIVTAASDLGSITVGYLNNKLNLKGINEKQVLSVSNKGQFADLQKKIGITELFSFKIRTIKELNLLKDEIPAYPVIMKPLIASGSKGIRVCSSFDELLKWHEEVFDSSFIKKGYLVQKFMEGEEIGGECLIENGEVRFICNTRKLKNKLHVPVGHLVPIQIRSDVREQINYKISKIISYLNITDTVINFDTILSSDGKVEIIDLSLRSGGNLIPELLRYKYNIDIYDRIIDYSLGSKRENLSVLENDSFYGSIIFGSLNRRVFSLDLKDKIIKVLQHKCKIIDLIFDIEPGEIIELFDQGNKRFGHALVKCESEDDYLYVIKELYGKGGCLC